MSESTLRETLERALKGLRQSSRQGWDDAEHYRGVDHAISKALTQLEALEEIRRLAGDRYSHSRLRKIQKILDKVLGTQERNDELG